MYRLNLLLLQNFSAPDDSWLVTWPESSTFVSLCVRPTTFLFRLLPLYIFLSFYSRWTSISSSSFHENKSTHTHTQLYGLWWINRSLLLRRAAFPVRLKVVICNCCVEGLHRAWLLYNVYSRKWTHTFGDWFFLLVPSCKRSWSNQRQLDLIVVPVRRQAFFYKYGNCRPRRCCFQWAHLMCTPIILYRGNW
jgi:hypothetical protein